MPIQPLPTADPAAGGGGGGGSAMPRRAGAALAPDLDFALVAAALALALALAFAFGAIRFRTKQSALPLALPLAAGPLQQIDDQRQISRSRRRAKKAFAQLPSRSYRANHVQCRLISLSLSESLSLKAD